MVRVLDAAHAQATEQLVIRKVTAATQGMSSSKVISQFVQLFAQSKPLGFNVSNGDGLTPPLDSMILFHLIWRLALNLIE